MGLRIFFIAFILLHNFFVSTPLSSDLHTKEPVDLLANERKVVLITGTSQGIGLEVAKKLAQTGYLVYAALRATSNPAYLDQAIKTCGQNLKSIQLDVTDAKSIDLAVQKILDQSGKIDILINNACEVVIGTCETSTLEEQMQVMDVNYFGVVRMLQAVLPHMRERNQGHIINMSSVAGFEPFPVIESYIASKFALEGLSESLAVYLDRWKIKVTLIEPAAVKTHVCFTARLGSRFLNETACLKKFCEEGKKPMQDSYGTSQPPKEIALLISKILEEEHPHLRYQTNLISSKMAESRFQDATGDRPLFLKRIKQRSLLEFLPLQ